MHTSPADTPSNAEDVFPQAEQILTAVCADSREERGQAVEADHL